MRISDWSSDVCSSDLVGLWRMMEVTDRLGIPCTVSLNMANWEHYPEIMAAMVERDWDVLCHGIYNTQYQWGLPEDEERAMIADCVETYRRFTGRQLRGWFSPAATFTHNTPDLVAERSEEHTSELQSLMRISYAVFCLKKKNK